MKDKRGFTLIELVVVIGLAGIVISVVMSFFMTNYRSYEAINIQSEVQYDSQYIINFMTNKILEAKSYEGETNNQHIFKYSNDKEAYFEVENKKLKYNHESDSSITIGNNIKDLNIETVSNNGVKITLTLDKGKSDSYSAEQVIYMRNSSN